MVFFSLFSKRSPKNASWKYIERIGDHFLIPYGEMSCEWMERVYQRAKKIARIRKERGFDNDQNINYRTGKNCRPGACLGPKGYNGRHQGGFF